MCHVSSAMHASLFYLYAPSAPLLPTQLQLPQTYSFCANTHTIITCHSCCGLVSPLPARTQITWMLLRRYAGSCLPAMRCLPAIRAALLSAARTGMLPGHRGFTCVLPLPACRLRMLHRCARRVTIARWDYRSMDACRCIVLLYRSTRALYYVQAVSGLVPFTFCIPTAAVPAWLRPALPMPGYYLLCHAGRIPCLVAFLPCLLLPLLVLLQDFFLVSCHLILCFCWASCLPTTGSFLLQILHCCPRTMPFLTCLRTAPTPSWTACVLSQFPACSATLACYQLLQF